MVSKGEVRAEMGLARQKASESLGALRQAQSQLEEAQAVMMRVAEGTVRQEVRDLVAELQQVVSRLDEVEQLARAAADNIEAAAQQE